MVCSLRNSAHPRSWIMFPPCFAIRNPIRPTTMTPLPIAHEELAAIMYACQPLAPDRRTAFMEAVASTLATCPVIGPGTVHRAIIIAQRAHFDPPMMDGHAVATRGRYR